MKNIGWLIGILFLVSCEGERKTSESVHFELGHSKGDSVSLSEWMIPLELVGVLLVLLAAFG